MWKNEPHVTETACVRLLSVIKSAPLEEAYYILNFVLIPPFFEMVRPTSPLITEFVGRKHFEICVCYCLPTIFSVQVAGLAPGRDGNLCYHWFSRPEVAEKYRILY